MIRIALITMMAIGVTLALGCDRKVADSGEPASPAKPSADAVYAEGDGHDHDHDHGSEEAVPADAHAGDHDHGHGEEVSLGTATIGDMKVELAQGHGHIVAGGGSHLVVKLPHNDKGATVVRAWVGTEDRTLSFVGKGAYAAAHDDYDIHVMAPDPLPEDVRWWVEIEKPDGTRAVGSAQPLMD